MTNTNIYLKIMINFSILIKQLGLYSPILFNQYQTSQHKAFNQPVLKYSSITPSSVPLRQSIPKYLEILYPPPLMDLITLITIYALFSIKNNYSQLAHIFYAALINNCCFSSCNLSYLDLKLDWVYLGLFNYSYLFIYRIE